MQKESILSLYGPLMTIGDLAGLLRRSPNGLRFTMRGRSELAHRLTAARVRIGRRVHFDTDAIANLLVSGASTRESDG